MWKPSFFKIGFVVALSLTMIMPLSSASPQASHPAITLPQQASSGSSIIFQDGFENYTDFALDFPPWTTLDIDGSPTFGMDYYDWPHEGEPQAFIIFNPSTTTPPMTGIPDAQPHSGSKYAAAFNDDNTGDANNDWLITPQLYGTFTSLTFWAKTYSNLYNLERFQIGVSTTTTDPSAFTIISPSPYVLVPTSWTPFTFDLGSHYGKYYIGIHCCSTNSWFLMIDDLQIIGEPGQDITPPVTTCQLNGTMQGDIYTHHVTVTLKATDEKSGVNYTKYQLDGGVIKTYIGPFTVFPDGTHTITYYSVDNAGNTETSKTATFTIQHQLKITIKGGLGVTVTLQNTGTTALDVAWRIELTGHVLSGSLKENTTTIAAGGQYKIKDQILGIGKTTITVSADEISKTATAKIWLFFVLGVS